LDTTQKKVDLPPKGSSNPDPITDQPGSRPIETGIGAAVVGAASGLAVGAVAGPVGAAVGVAVGAVAGGLAGGHKAAEPSLSSFELCYIGQGERGIPRQLQHGRRRRVGRLSQGGRLPLHTRPVIAERPPCPVRH
jgi:hypothetical protein